MLMAYDGKLLARAREKLDNRKTDNAAEHQRRVALIHARIPEIAQIDREMQGQMRDLMGAAISHGEDTGRKVAALEKENLAL